MADLGAPMQLGGWDASHAEEELEGTDLFNIGKAFNDVKHGVENTKQKFDQAGKDFVRKGQALIKQHGTCSATRKNASQGGGMLVHEDKCKKGRSPTLIGNDGCICN